MERQQRLIRPVEEPRDARLTCSRAWEPFGSRTPLRSAADEQRTLRRQRPSASETTWLCLMLTMCVVTVLDLHASARRETQRAAIANTVLESTALSTSQHDGSAVADAARAAMESRTARSSAANHQSSKKAAAASRPARKLRVYSKQQVQDLIRRHASAHGVDPELPLAIAQCESGFRWDASNRTSSARGVFQFLKGTWRTTSEGRKGTSVLDADAHVRMAVKTIATVGTSAWNASRRCWAETMSEAERQDMQPSEPVVEDSLPAEPETHEALNATE